MFRNDISKKTVNIKNCKITKEIHKKLLNQSSSFNKTFFSKSFSSFEKDYISSLDADVSDYSGEEYLFREVLEKSDNIRIELLRNALMYILVDKPKEFSPDFIINLSVKIF